MRRAIAASVACATIVACSAFVSLDGLNVPDEGGTGMPEAGMDAGIDTGIDTSADTHVPACPSGRGSAMIEIDGVCVDTFEATYAQYFQFLASLDGGVAGANLPPACAFKTSFNPQQLNNDVAMPIAWTDWCDAWAFCAWAGKELCGGIGGGAIPATAFADASVSLWMKACSKNGAQRWPYGTQYDPTACNLTQDPDGGGNMGPRHPGASPKCQGGYPGLYDMVGNVREWENACASNSGANDECRRRGGSFNEEPRAGVDCDYDETYTRDFRSETSGFRCCSQKK